ncbi:MAG: endonuclease domain-containing protein [Chloroflexi bacterium]|nr:endonuclease domain-containing protein [Chloroflexota bacterium]
MEACGYKVMRVTSHDVEHNLDVVINRIRSALVSCKNRSASPPRRP